MADNVAITAGTGTTIAADELTDPTLGACKVQYVKIMDGTIDGTTKATVGANGLAVTVNAALPTGANTIGAVTGSGAAGTAATGVVTVQGIAGAVAQPVSLATNTPDVTDRAARLLGVVAGGGTAGTPATGVVTVQGIASGTPQPVTNSAGTALMGAVALTDGLKTTYSGTINGTNVASAVTAAVPLWELANPAASGKVIRVLRIFVQLTLATAGTAPLLELMKQSALSTAGTAVTQTAVPLDSANAAAVATLKLYTAIPGAGAVVGIVRSARLFGVATTMTIQPNGIEWTFGNRPGTGLVLRAGTSVAIMGQAAFATVPTITGDVEWTEE